MNSLNRYTVQSVYTLSESTEGVALCCSAAFRLQLNPSLIDNRDYAMQLLLKH